MVRRSVERAAAVLKMTQRLHKYPVYDLLEEGAIELIHAASLRILSEAGIAIHDDELL